MTRVPRLMAIRALDNELIGLENWGVSLARRGVDSIQLRDKDASDKRLYRACRSLAVALRESLANAQGAGASSTPPMLLLNRRPDLALAAGADGVHLPARGLPTRAVREAFGPAFVIGRSTHSIDEVARARSEGADYVVFGPVFPTPEKLRFGAPLGLGELERAAAVGLPVLAIGGITEDRLEAVARSGASGAAAIRLFENPVRAAAVVERARSVFDPIGAPARV